MIQVDWILVTNKKQIPLNKELLVKWKDNSIEILSFENGDDLKLFDDIIAYSTLEEKPKEEITKETILKNFVDSLNKFSPIKYEYKKHYDMIVSLFQNNPLFHRIVETIFENQDLDVLYQIIFRLFKMVDSKGEDSQRKDLVTYSFSVSEKEVEELNDLLILAHRMIQTINPNYRELSTWENNLKKFKEKFSKVEF